MFERINLIDVITMKQLRIALRNTLGKKGMDEQTIRALADYLLNLFGYEDCIVDNILSPSDRNVFYMLEDEGILGIKEEEVAIKKGKIWRLYYWFFKKERIAQLISTLTGKETEDIQHDYAIYEKVPQHVWERHVLAE